MAQSRSGSGRRGRSRGRDEGEALRGLVGPGPTKVGISAAMRARDASRPDDEDVAAAEAMPPPRVGPPATAPARPRDEAPDAAGQPPADGGSSTPAGNGGNEPSSS